MTSDSSPETQAKPITYRDAGVDIDAGNALVEAIKPMVKATSRSGSMGGIGGFGGLFDLKAAGYDDPILVAANDGVGTKLKIAIETGLHDTIGIDLVAMCVNDLIVQGAEPLFFLDYLATARLDVDVAKTVISGIAEGCRQAGCALIGGETAEMPGMYHGADYDLAGFSVGAAERSKLLPLDTIAAGDVLIGLKSSGIHSNGYSLIRRLVSEAKLKWSDVAPWQSEMTVAQSLLEPTRIYVKPILSALRCESDALRGLKALAHITGGGLSENLPRVLPPSLVAHIDLSTFEPPAVFSWVAARGNLSDGEMLRTFNCGIGMVCVVACAQADEIMNTLLKEGETAVRIGSLEVMKPSSSEQGDLSSQVVYEGCLRVQR